MKEVLEKILNAEAEAQKSILLAQKQAADIIKQAKSGAAQIRTDIITRAEESAGKRRREAQNKFSSQKDETIKQITSETRSLSGEWEKNVLPFAEEIFQKVIKPET